MEQINRIEILGTVGNVRVSEFEDGGRCVHASVVTNYVYNNKAGETIMDATWHNVTIRPGRWIKQEMLDKIVKGAIVKVVGRVKTSRYTTLDGTERSSYDIIASKLEFPTPDGEPLKAMMM